MLTLIRAFAFLLVLVVPATTASLRSGSQTCPSSGIKALSPTTTIKASWISIQSPSGNSGVIAVGGSTVTVAASCAAAIGNCMNASGSAFLPPLSNTSAYDLSQTFIACTSSSDSVMYNYLQ